MIIHNFDPVLLQLGPIAIRWYGLVYVLGFVGMYYALRKIGNFTTKEADSLLTWLIIGLLLGARSFFFSFYRPDLFSVTEFFAVWNGGMSFHGAFTGLLIATFWWAKRNNKDVWMIADIGALITPWFLALGRFANFINSEIIGTAFDGAWCVVFAGVDGCRHPVQMYALFKNIVLGTIVLWLYKARSFAAGFLFWAFATVYGVFRFIVNFWRDDPVVLFSWLKMGHILSVALVIVAATVIIKKYPAELPKLFLKPKKSSKK